MNKIPKCSRCKKPIKKNEKVIIDSMYDVTDDDRVIKISICTHQKCDDLHKICDDLHKICRKKHKRHPRIAENAQNSPN